MGNRILKRPGIILAIIAIILAIEPGTAGVIPATKFGVMLGAPGMDLDRRIGLARTLGVSAVRPNDVRIPGWRGPDPEVVEFSRAGFEIILTVRNAPPGPGQPAVPPSDIHSFQSTLGAILDAYRPTLLVVENEENSNLFYRGTPEEYAAELQVACQVAHTRGVKCTNGGLVSALVAMLVYDGYRMSGQAARAEAFAARAFTPSERRRLQTPQAQDQLARGRALLARYKAAGADFLNIHWYIPDSQALREAANYLREQTGLPLLTNEIGQRDDNPHTTTALLGTVLNLGFPYAVWFSIDTGRARALMNPDGSLRPTGRAFQNFMAGRR